MTVDAPTYTHAANERVNSKPPTQTHKWKKSWYISLLAMDGVRGRNPDKSVYWQWMESEVSFTTSNGVDGVKYRCRYKWGNRIHTIDPLYSAIVLLWLAVNAVLPWGEPRLSFQWRSLRVFRGPLSFSHWCGFWALQRKRKRDDGHVHSGSRECHVDLSTWPSSSKWRRRLVSKCKKLYLGRVAHSATRLVSRGALHGYRRLTLSLLRVINVKIPLQPHHKYYSTQYGELDFS